MPAVARYLIDNDPDSLSTLAEFIDANETLDADEVAAIAALKPGETYSAGGGAGAEWTITRLPDPWQATYSNEGTDRAAALATAMTEADRKAGREAPGYGYSRANFALADRLITDAARRFYTESAADWDLPEAAPASERPAPTDEEIDRAAHRAAMQVSL